VMRCVSSPVAARSRIRSSLNQARKFQGQIQTSSVRLGIVEDTMTLVRELKGLTDEYLAGTRSLEDIRTWLIQHAQEIVDQEDPWLDDLDGLLWLLISEYDLRDRDEVSIRDELRAALRPETSATAQPRSRPG
jgi:hypothetical protein